MIVKAIKPFGEFEDMELTTLSEMQEFVGGYIQALPVANKTLLVCNDEGKLMGLEPTLALIGQQGNVIDIVVGNVFLCGAGVEDFTDITEQGFREAMTRMRVM